MEVGKIVDLGGKLEPKGIIARDRLREILEQPWCTGCHRITDLRECWGCKKHFCYECLIEHMMGCEEWQKIKQDYQPIFECSQHETCNDCPLRFKCYTQRKKVKDAKGNS
jgi:hypothetical protein